MSEVYPALARVPPELFGICVAAVDGRVHSVGDAEIPFTIMRASRSRSRSHSCATRSAPTRSSGASA